MSATNNNSINNDESSFGLPENYFQRSERSILNKAEWLDEHAELTRLSQLKTRLNSSYYGFDFPLDYFTTFHSRAELLPFSNLHLISKANNFKVPEGYFDELNSKLVLTSIQKTSKQNKGFSNHFFSKNNHPLSIARKRVSLAIAAVLLISFGFWIIQSTKQKIDLSECNSLACLEKQTILNNLNELNFENDELYELVNPQDLQEELDIDVIQNEKNNLLHHDSQQTSSDLNLNDL